MHQNPKGVKMLLGYSLKSHKIKGSNVEAFLESVMARSQTWRATRIPAWKWGPVPKIGTIEQRRESVPFNVQCLQSITVSLDQGNPSGWVPEPV